MAHNVKTIPTGNEVFQTIYDPDTGTNSLIDSQSVLRAEGTKSATLDVKVALSGAGSTLPMTTNLAAALLPLAEPYEGLGYHRVGFSGETVANQAVFTTNNITDWVLIELRDKRNPEIVKYNRAALLRNDGQVMEVDGTTNVTFTNILLDKYYIAIKHRNHLGIMSATAVELSTAVDFTDDGYTPWGVDNRYVDGSNRLLKVGSYSQQGYSSYERSLFLTYEELSYDAAGKQDDVYSIYDTNLDGYVRFSDEFIPPSTFINSDSYKVFTILGGVPDTVVIEQIPPVLQLYVINNNNKNISFVQRDDTSSEPTANSVLKGAIRFDTDTNKFRGCDGSTWRDLDLLAETKELEFPNLHTNPDDSYLILAGIVRKGVLVPASFNGMNLTNVIASVYTSGAGNSTDIQIIRRRGGAEVNMLSTPVTITGGEYFAEDGVIDASNDDVQTGDVLYVNVTGTTTANSYGLRVVVEFNNP